MISHADLVAWCFAFGVVDISIIVSNCLAIAAFTRTRLLRKCTNYFLFTLAVADIMVGTLSLPMYIHHLVLWSRGNGEVPWTEVYTTMDVFFGFASIFALTVISLERLYSVALPNWHRTTPKDIYTLLVVVIWSLAVVMAIFRIVFSVNLINPQTLHYIMIVVLFLCLLVICLAYVVIWIKVKLRFHEKTKKSVEKDRKLAMTLLIVTAIFMITWLPFYVINITYAFCSETCQQTPFNVVFFSKLLHYSNSFVNPIIYAFKIPEFRRALLTLFGRHSARRASKASKMTNGERRPRKSTFRSSESQESAL